MSALSTYTIVFSWKLVSSIWNKENQTGLLLQGRVGLSLHNLSIVVTSVHLDAVKSVQLCICTSIHLYVCISMLRSSSHVFISASTHLYTDPCIDVSLIHWCIGTCHRYMSNYIDVSIPLYVSIRYIDAYIHQSICTPTYLYMSIHTSTHRFIDSSTSTHAYRHAKRDRSLCIQSKFGEGGRRGERALGWAPYGGQLRQ